MIIRQVETSSTWTVNFQYLFQIINETHLTYLDLYRETSKKHLNKFKVNSYGKSQYTSNTKLIYKRINDVSITDNDSTERSIESITFYDSSENSYVVG